MNIENYPVVENFQVLIDC